MLVAPVNFDDGRPNVCRSPLRFLLSALILVGTILPCTVSAQERVTQSADFRGLRDSVYHVQAYSRAVTKIQKDLDAGRTSDALLVLQQLLDQPHDSFILSDERNRALTLRSEISHLLAKQPDNVIREYEKTTGQLAKAVLTEAINCLLYTSPSPRDRQKSRMPSSA